jgi:iron uptake system component EfeO
MRQFSKTGFSIVVAGAALALTAGACGSSAKSGGPAGNTDVRTVEFKLTDAGCDPAHLELPPGATTFHITNDGADAVTEMELQQGGRILGESENLTPGLSGSFSVALQPGTYETLCPNGSHAAKGDVVVSGTAVSTTTLPAGSAAATAVADYRRYVEGEAKALVQETTKFVTAVKAGDVAAAKEQYPVARTHYETIEPIAESFADLDPKIDARANDLPPAEFGGFHRMEQQLWVSNNTTGMSAVADELLANVTTLQASIPGLKLQAAQIANGAVELMNEVASSKISGEEDRYSHTDLWDFDANDDGSIAAFEAVRPIVAAKDEPLADTIDRQFAEVDAALDAYKTPGGGFQLYTQLTKTQTRALAAKVEAVADSLAKVPPLVVAG